MSTAARFTVDEYERMITCGAFDGPNQKRIELFRGELRMMSPPGAAHAELLGELDEWSQSVGDRSQVKIRIQSSIHIGELDTQSEPDLVWARRKSYAQRRPEPHEILLLAEVADTSLAYDLGDKCQLYAAAGICDYWVFDIPNRIVHVFRDPSHEGFQQLDTFSVDDQISPLTDENISLSIGRIFACLGE